MRIEIVVNERIVEAGTKVKIYRFRKITILPQATGTLMDPPLVSPVII
jgi:hypothetical protein